jgi:hypothetical protein
MHWFRVDRARSELGYSPRPSDEATMAEVVEWFRIRWGD